MKVSQQELKGSPKEPKSKTSHLDLGTDRSSASAEGHCGCATPVPRPHRAWLGKENPLEMQKPRGTTQTDTWPGFCPPRGLGTVGQSPHATHGTTGVVTVPSQLRNPKYSRGVTLPALNLGNGDTTSPNPPWVELGWMKPSSSSSSGTALSL